MTIADLRDRGLFPALFSDRVADGVLHDVGLAAWEMPATATGGGYTHYARPQYHEDHEAFMAPAFRSNPAMVTRSSMASLHQALHVSEHGTMRLEDLPTVYGKGTSLALQNCVLAPDRSVGGVDSFYDYEADVQAILAQWAGGRRLYLHCGVANNEQFPTGSPRFNAHYGLRCRPASNLLFGAVSPSHLGIGADTYVHQASLICADAVVRPWVRTVMDPTNPGVVALAHAQIAQLVSQFGTAASYVVHGESSMIAFLPPLPGAPDRGPCEKEPLPESCSHCEPAAAYSTALNAAFRAYLEHELGITTVAELNERWESDLSSLDDVAPTTPGFFCPGLPNGLRDYLGFLRWLLSEAAIQEYHAAKGANPMIKASAMRFGPAGLEQSWLAGDFGSVGDWSAETWSTYVTDRRHVLETITTAARLSGVPMCWPITAPPFIPNAPDPNQYSAPVILLPIRTYQQAQARSFFRDVMTSGAAHIGYLKAPVVSFGQDPDSVAAILGVVEDIVSRHEEQFAFCGAWQRVVLHCERFDGFDHPPLDDGCGRVTSHLLRRFRTRRVPVALCSDDRVRVRPLSRWWLGRSIVIVPFHSRADEIRADYETLFPAGAPGAALFVHDAAGSPPAWVDDAVELGTPVGALHRAASGANVWYLACREAGPCTVDELWGAIAATIDAWVRPHMLQDVATEPVPHVADPIEVTLDAGVHATDVVATTVTDGLNFTVGLTNLSAAEQKLFLHVRPEIAQGLGVQYSVHEVSLPPGETEFVTLLAEGHGVDVEQAIDGGQANLSTVDPSYDTAAADAALTRAEALRGAGHEARALAGYLAAVRMPILRTTVLTSPLRVRVDVLRLGLFGELEPTTPIEGAQVLFVWPLNGREEGASGTTDGTGSVTLEVGAPAQERWDYAAGEFVAPAQDAAAVVEVQVTDPATGASSRATVSLV